MKDPSKLLDKEKAAQLAMMFAFGKVGRKMKISKGGKGKPQVGGGKHDGGGGEVPEGSRPIPKPTKNSPKDGGDITPASPKECPKISKNAEKLRTGGNNTAVEVKSKAEADALLKEAFLDYQKVNGVGPNDPSGLRKKRKMDRFEQDGAYHKDFYVDPKTNRVKNHADDNDHGTYPYINIKRKDGKKVLIDINDKKKKGCDSDSK